MPQASATARTTRTTRTTHDLSRTRRRPSVRSASNATKPGEPDILARCVETCNETLSYCLEQGGEHAERAHILSILDCIDACWFVAGLESRDSELVDEALQVCATACKACEESCEEFEGDEQVTRCADLCREGYEYCSR